jgi:hypothetical protein
MNQTSEACSYESKVLTGVVSFPQNMTGLYYSNQPGSCQYAFKPNGNT